MNQGIVKSRVLLLSTLFGLILAVYLFFPSPALAESALGGLKKIIIALNLKILQESLDDGSYRGEEGILRIIPEAGKSLGMKVFIDQDYLDARDLFRRADGFLEKAERALASKKKEKFPAEHAQRIANYFLLFNENVELAKKKLMAYRSRLNPRVDDRLNEDISIKVMGRLLLDSLKRTENNLRDALGRLYNVCQGVNQKDHALITENVRFVNEVFHQFIGQASEETMNMFDLDRSYGPNNSGFPHNWKHVVGKQGSRYIPFLEAAIKKYGNREYPVDPLLFIALMKRESNFDPVAISHMGAAGLTQIMPRTGRNLGMKNIYMPPYFSEAVSLLGDERKLSREAMAALFQINEENKLHYATMARVLTQKSLVFGQKREKLFARYKKELLRNRTDERLKPAQAIEFGFKYFARLMKDQKGDISLALASYNAGAHRVREFNGIPPYEETVLFRNRVLRYYRDYLRKAKDGKG